MRLLATLMLIVVAGCAGTVDATLHGAASVTGANAARPCTGDPLAAPGVLGLALDGAHDTVFVIEASGAMLAPVPCAAGAPRAFDVAREGVRRGLDQLPDGTRVDVMVLAGNEPARLWREPRALDATTRAAARQFVDAATCDNRAFMGGPYGLTDAVREAPRLVYLGAGNAESAVGWDVILSWAHDWPEKGVRVDVAALGTAKDEHVMRELAARTGGSVAVW